MSTTRNRRLVEPVIPPKQSVVPDTETNDTVMFLSESDTLHKSRKMSIDQRYYEYLHYMSSFPKLIPFDKNKLKSKIEEILG